MLADAHPFDMPPMQFDDGSLPIPLGLLIVVQGFETTRLMGADFDSTARIRAMLIA